MIEGAAASLFLEVCLDLALAALGVALVPILARILAGPTLPDRVIGLDMLTAAAIALAGLVAIRTGNAVYADVAIGLVLVGFLGTVALARFVTLRGQAGEAEAAEVQEVGPPPGPGVAGGGEA